MGRSCHSRRFDGLGAVLAGGQRPAGEVEHAGRGQPHHQRDRQPHRPAGRRRGGTGWTGPEGAGAAGRVVEAAALTTRAPAGRGRRRVCHARDARRPGRAHQARRPDHCPAPGSGQADLLAGERSPQAVGEDVGGGDPLVRVAGESVLHHRGQGPGDVRPPGERLVGRRLGRSQHRVGSRCVVRRPAGQRLVADGRQRVHVAARVRWGPVQPERGTGPSPSRSDRRASRSPCRSRTPSRMRRPGRPARGPRRSRRAGVRRRR